jgi:two-component system nitrate/nitrite response regulator NarL
MMCHACHLPLSTPPFAPRATPLTRRETEVADLVARAMQNKQIAHALGISDHTVRQHLASIFQKLHIQDRVSLVLYHLEAQRAAR